MDGCNQHHSPVNAIYELFAECRCLSPISGVGPGRPVLPVPSEPCAVRGAQAVRWRPGETQHQWPVTRGTSGVSSDESQAHCQYQWHQQRPQWQRTLTCSSVLLLCWRKRVRIRASHWQFGEVVRERREILIIASKYWLWYRAPPGLYICPQYWVSIFLHWESRSDSRDNAKWSTGRGREHTQEICATRMKYWLRVTGKGNVIRCWWIFSYMWSAWRMGSH